jgi:hypothetical protein
MKPDREKNEEEIVAGVATVGRPTNLTIACNKGIRSPLPSHPHTAFLIGIQKGKSLVKPFKGEVDLDRLLTGNGE